MVAVLAGLIGAIVGAFFSAYAASRVERRSGAWVSSHLALDGLRRWLDMSSRFADQARERPGADHPEVKLAIQISGFRKANNLDWWDFNRVGLLGLATEDEFSALSAAASAGADILSLADQVGDAGEEANLKLARVRIKVERMRREFERKPRASQPPVEDADEAEFRALMRETDDLMEQADVVYTDTIEGLGAVMDYRLDLAETVYRILETERDKFEEARKCCEVIARRAKSWRSFFWTGRPST